MMSSSVQKALTSSSSSVSSTKLPVKHEAREKIHIKQVFGSDEKTSGEYLCSVYLPTPTPSLHVDKKIIRSPNTFWVNRNCQTLYKGR